MIRNFNPATSQPNHNHAQSQMSVAGPSSGLVGGNGAVAVPGGSAGHEPPVNPASKVAEVFLTAGHAFQKLGDLTLQLHCNNSERDESKWCEADVDALRNALTRFAHELDTISESVQSRTTKHIKTDIKRRTLLGDDMAGGGAGGMGGSGVARRAHSPAVSTLQVSGKRPAPSSMSTGPVMQKRIATGTTTIAKGYAPARQVVGYSSAGPSGGHMMHSGGGGGGGHSSGHVLNPNNISLSSGGGSAQPTPLLADPSHHYISARMPDIGPSTF